MVKIDLMWYYSTLYAFCMVKTKNRRYDYSLLIEYIVSMHKALDCR